MTRNPRKSRTVRKGAPKTRKVPRNPRQPAARRDSLDEFIAAAASVLNLKIEEAWLPEVRGHLEVTLQHGALVADFALPDEADPAPVFEA
jgi:hypothetical protein